jgi:hypothetical protein
MPSSRREAPLLDAYQCSGWEQAAGLGAEQRGRGLARCVLAAAAGSAKRLALFCRTGRQTETEGDSGSLAAISGRFVCRSRKPHCEFATEDV